MKSFKKLILVLTILTFFFGGIFEINAQGNRIQPVDDDPYGEPSDDNFPLYRVGPEDENPFNENPFDERDTTFDDLNPDPNRPPDPRPSEDVRNTITGNASGEAGAECGRGLGNNFKCAVRYIISLLNLLVPLIIGIALVLFLFGMIKYITAGGDEAKRKEGRNLIIFGLIGLFVMVSVWGLVNIVVNTFFPDKGSLVVPQLPD